MTAPVVVLLQGSVSVVGVLANLLAAPLVPIATVAGVAAALVSVVWPGGATLVAWVGIVPTTGIAQVARRFAEVPGGTMPWPDGWPGALLLAGLTARSSCSPAGRWSAGSRRTRRSRSGRRCSSPRALLPTGIVTWPPDGWRVVVCDVGQGDAIVVRSGPARAVLVDAGPDPPLVDRCLDRLGVATLDAVVLTHFHADHVDGLPGALSRALGRPGPRRPRRRARGRRPRGRAVSPRPAASRSSSCRRGPAARRRPRRRRVEPGPAHRRRVGPQQREPRPRRAHRDGRRPAPRRRRARVGPRPPPAPAPEPSMAVAAGGFEVVKTPHHGSANLDDEPDGRGPRTARRGQRRGRQRLRPPGASPPDGARRNGYTVCAPTATVTSPSSRRRRLGRGARDLPVTRWVRSTRPAQARAPSGALTATRASASASSVACTAGTRWRSSVVTARICRREAGVGRGRRRRWCATVRRMRSGTSATPEALGDQPEDRDVVLGLVRDVGAKPACGSAKEVATTARTPGDPVLVGEVDEVDLGPAGQRVVLRAPPAAPRRRAAA